ncbi:MAG: hypothetical protein K6F30_08100 [Lachnospiraceae bacterium]|nr:hypothetical protein [Lachnospiraceae bacterium]
MKKLFQDKTKGYLFTVAAMVFAVVTGIVYTVIYSSTKYYSREGIAIICCGVILSCVLLAFKLQRFAPAVMLVSSFIALLFHVYYIYFYISSVVTGIQFSGFPASFFVNFVLFGITLILSIISVFLPTEK